MPLASHECFDHIYTFWSLSEAFITSIVTFPNIHLILLVFFLFLSTRVKRPNCPCYTSRKVLTVSTKIALDYCYYCEFWYGHMQSHFWLSAALNMMFLVHVKLRTPCAWVTWVIWTCRQASAPWPLTSADLCPGLIPSTAPPSPKSEVRLGRRSGGRILDCPSFSRQLLKAFVACLLSWHWHSCWRSVLAPKDFRCTAERSFHWTVWDRLTHDGLRGRAFWSQMMHRRGRILLGAQLEENKGEVYKSNVAYGSFMHGQFTRK